jgi:Arc/MetJ-type ribon-helix-helix transcriptional regulator
MKLSVSLPDDECRFLDECVEGGHYPSRSAVILRALRLLRGADLGAMYAEAIAEWEASDEGADWDALDASSEVG